MSSVKRNRYIDGKLLLAYPDDYTVLDIETTGLSPQNDYITEISAIKYRNNRRVDEFSSLVKPELSIPYYITRLTGINDAMVADAPAIDEVILSFMDFLADDIIAGYNVAFDLSFIAENLAGHYAKRLANDYVDVMKLAQNELPFLGRYKQTAVAEYFNIATAGAHRALVDCNICNGCYQKLKELAVADYHLPPRIILPAMNLWFRTLAHYDTGEYSTTEALAKCRLPVLFIHGTGDDFVPYRMGEENAAAFRGDGTFISVSGAGHGMSYLVNREKCEKALDAFLAKTLGV